MKSNIIGLSILLIATLTYAFDKTISVLDFELTDTTIKINDVQEKIRTQSIQPLLAQALTKLGYKIIPVDHQLQNKANQGVGYIQSHPDVVAELGRKIGVDYVIVGRLHKPSYLFAYIIARVIDVKQTKLIARHVVEAKGRSMQATQKSIPNLAMKIVGSFKS